MKDASARKFLIVALIVLGALIDGFGWLIVRNACRPDGLASAFSSIILWSVEVALFGLFAVFLYEFVMRMEAWRANRFPSSNVMLRDGDSFAYAKDTIKCKGDYRLVIWHLGSYPDDKFFAAVIQKGNSISMCLPLGKNGDISLRAYVKIKLLGLWELEKRKI